MLRVVIIEDEYYVRKGMIQTIPWSTLNCKIVGEASNGKEGIKVVEKLKPNIVITDIEMPVISGIEMMRILRRNGCIAHFIFLTAHQKFTYVHEALKMEVVDYLLKPVNHDELAKSIQKIGDRFYRNNIQALTKESEDEDNIQANNIYIKRAILYVRNNYTKDISVTTVSQYLAISEAYFCRLFKKETGFTFWQYLTNYRIHVATGLLYNFPLKIYEVANQVGFADTNYFSVVFKKIMGVTPTEYQEQHHV